MHDVPTATIVVPMLAFSETLRIVRTSREVRQQLIHRTPMNPCVFVCVCVSGWGCNGLPQVPKVAYHTHFETPKIILKNSNLLVQSLSTSRCRACWRSLYCKFEAMLITKNHWLSVIWSSISHFYRWNILRCFTNNNIFRHSGNYLKLFVLLYRSEIGAVVFRRKCLPIRRAQYIAAELRKRSS